MALAAAPRVAIVGAGISGLALGAILSRKLPQAQLTVLERSHLNRDEGYGLDLDEFGQQALVRAGVFDRFWDVSRKRSNTWRAYPVRGDKPLMRKFSRVMEAESNRAAIRDLFMDAMHTRGVAVQYEQRVADVRAAGADGRGIEVVGHDGESLGEFDLVVDSSGLHSPLRHHRVHDEVGKHFAGRTLIHGVVENPEASLPPVVVERLGEGTLQVVGRGYHLLLQRFAADLADKRAAFFYMPDLRAADGEIQAEMGVGESRSREAGILRPGQADFDKVREWLHADMRGVFDPVYHDIVDGLARVTVRGMYSHGEGTALRAGGGGGGGGDGGTLLLPLVCCGDSLRNIGLGGGGNLAIQDALAYAEALARPGAFSGETGRLEPAALEALRAAEAAALKRKHDHFSRTTGTQDVMFTRREGQELVTRFGDLADKIHWRLLLNAGHALLRLGTRFAAARGWTRGADETTRLHKEVEAALRDEEEWQKAQQQQ